ncbi:hypothetical protein T03_16078 [Trichinella britovi]|uniref:Uncharacterized protein n=1 Tax=Trichinella britovi TaxID=45882 RepID=A0A0V1D5P9_TRIBR|nr:hypothetical protein T03_16078 [Trichinella britovi]
MRIQDHLDKRVEFTKRERSFDEAFHELDILMTVHWIGILRAESPTSLTIHLIRHKTSSDEALCSKRKQTIHVYGLGDHTPSQIISQMLAMLDWHEPCFFFWKILLEQMTTDTCLILWNASFTNTRLSR